MESINHRLRQLREKLSLSQTEFAESLGVGRGVIKNLEEFRTDPKPAFLSVVIKNFNVNPVWLETGQGEMFRDLSREEKIAAFVGEALADETDSFKRDLISLLASLDEAGWQTLRDAAKVIVDALQKQKEEE